MSVERIRGTESTRVDLTHEGAIRESRSTETVIFRQRLFVRAQPETGVISVFLADPDYAGDEAPFAMNLVIIAPEAARHVAALIIAAAETLERVRG